MQAVGLGLKVTSHILWRVRRDGFGRCLTRKHLVVLFGAVFAFGANAGSSILEIEDDMVAFVVAENEHARELVTTASYTLNYSRKYVSNTSWKSISGVQEVVHGEQGGFWLATQWQRTDESTHAIEFTDSHSVVRNRKFVAIQDNELPVYVFLHDDPSLPNPVGLERPETMNQRDILGHAFGSGPGTSLREYISHEFVRSTVEMVTTGDGETVYELVNYNSRYSLDPADPESVFVIDPQKGFLVSSAKFFNKGGSPWIERTVDITQVIDINGNPLWFPVAMTEQSYGRSTDTANIVDADSSTSIAVNDIVVNSTLPSAQFAITSLRNADLTQPMLVWNMDGSQWTAGYFGGMLLPFDEASRMRHAGDPGKIASELLVEAGRAAVGDDETASLASFAQRELKPNNAIVAKEQKPTRERSWRVIVVLAFGLATFVSVAIAKGRKHTNDQVSGRCD